MATQQSGYQSALRDEEGWHDLTARAEKLRNRAKELREIDATLKDIDNLFVSNPEKACEQLRIALTHAPEDRRLLQICKDQGRRLLGEQLFVDALNVLNSGLNYGRGDLLTELRSLSYVARLLQADRIRDYNELVRNATRLDSLGGIASEYKDVLYNSLINCYTDLLESGDFDVLLPQLQASITGLFPEKSKEQFEKLKTKIEEIRSKTELLTIERLQRRATEYLGKKIYDNAIIIYDEALKLAERRTSNQSDTGELITNLQKGKTRTELYRSLALAQAQYQKSLRHGEPFDNTLGDAEIACQAILTNDQLTELTDIVSEAGRIKTAIRVFHENWRTQQSALKNAKAFFDIAQSYEPLQAIKPLEDALDYCKRIEQAISDYSDVRKVQSKITKLLSEHRLSLDTIKSFTPEYMHELAEKVAKLQPDRTFVLPAEFKNSLAESIAAEVARLQPAPTFVLPAEFENSLAKNIAAVVLSSISKSDGISPTEPNTQGSITTKWTERVSSLFSSERKPSKYSLDNLERMAVLAVGFLFLIFVMFMLPQMINPPSGNPPSQNSPMGGTASASTTPTSRATATASVIPTSRPTLVPKPTIPPTSVPTTPLNVKLTITLSDIEVPQPTPDPAQNSTSVPAPTPITAQVNADDKGNWTECDQNVWIDGGKLFKCWRLSPHQDAVDYHKAL